MMHRLKTIGALLSGLFVAHTGWTQHGLLWRVEGHGHTGFVYGTMHTGDSIANSMDSTVYNTLFRCHTLLLEADMSAVPDPSRIYEMMQLPQGKLQDNFSEKDWSDLSLYLETHLDPMSMLLKDNLQPIFILMMLQAQEEAERTKVESSELIEEAMDMRFHKAASKHKIESVGLEAWSEQIQALSAIPVQEQAEMLLQMVQGKRMSAMIIQDVVLSYYEQDLTKMIADMDLSDPLQRKFFDAVLFERNELFVERALPYFKSDSTFMAVGALHLAGDKGVLELLRQKGFRVEHVPFTFLKYKQNK